MDKIKSMWRDVVVGVLLYGVLMSLSGYLLYDRYQHQKELYINHQIEMAAVEFESLKEAYNTIADTIFHTTINTPQVRELMHKAAVSSDKRDRERYRKELHTKLLDLYSLLEENNIRQLHFHLPESISFLRFHRPEKYGDSLKNVRPSIDAVNRTGKSVHGFEEGRIINGFRHVYPLFHEKNFVGSVELSYSFDAIRELAAKLYPAQYDLILKKSEIKKKVFEEERANYSSSLISGEYVHDQKLNQDYFPLYSNSVIKEINTILLQTPELTMGEPYTQLIPLEIDDQGFVVVFNPLHSFDHHLVGYVVRYQLENHYIELWKNFQSLFWIAAVVNGVLVIVLLSFVRRIRKQKTLLQKMADTDNLTKIANRGALERFLRDHIIAAERYKEPLSLIFFDIDHFKQINDRYGHPAGDQALIDLSRMVRHRLRQSDGFGRWGGEEFVIVLPKTKRQEGAALAEELRKMIEAHPFAHGSMSCSFGLVQLAYQEESDALIRRADEMLYRAKESGRNRVISDSH